MSQITPAGAAGQIAHEFRNRIIAAIVAGLVAGVISAVLAIWGYLQTYVGAIGLVPKGSVIAFAGECPKNGWEPFTDGVGKFIVGAGEGGRLDPKKGGASTGPSTPLSAYAHLDQGGEEAHKLTVPELPAHSHQQVWGQGVGKLAIGWGESIRNLPGAPMLQRTLDEGGNAPHNNLPPYIALNLCMRTG